MLSQKQIDEIREHLEKAQNPVFFFDNDADGLCSFLLLQRFIGRGRGVPIKSFPEMTVDYFRKVTELNADYIFILDKHAVSEEFFKEVEQINLPVIWIDHHKTNTKIPKFVNYYNPLINAPDSYIPVTFICYKIVQKKEDLWIAVAGCIYDGVVPDFYPEFEKKFPEVSIKSDKAFEIYFKSGIGKITQIFNFALKDKITNVVNMLKFLMKANSPNDVLEENSRNHIMHERFNQIKKRYDPLIKKAKIIGKNSGKILFFQYSGDMSISADIARELAYLFPEKIIIVAYISGEKVNISVRGKNSREKILKFIDGLEGATGGGHEEAVGIKISKNDLEKFRERLKEIE